VDQHSPSFTTLGDRVSSRRSTAHSKSRGSDAQFTSIARYKDTDGGSTNEVATSEYSYDTLARLTDVAHKKGGSNLFTPYSWTYDYLSRVTGVTSQDSTIRNLSDADQRFRLRFDDPSDGFFVLMVSSFQGLRP